MTHAVAPRTPARRDASAAPTEIQLVVPLEELSAGDAAIAGGKGANLGELAASGLPVPRGFVATVAAYEDARDRAGLLPQLRRLFDDLDVEDAASLSAACDAAIDAVHEAPLPVEVQEALRSAYRTLVADDEAHTVIVRSSATLEDSAQASFAGMNRTFANVRTIESMLDAVKSCWASQFAPRSVYYRVRNGFPVAEATIAVVVQRYVPALQAGVMFTVDPATGHRGHLVIEATVGGGEAVVSGRVTPDRFVVDTRTIDVVARHVEHKELRVDDVATGGTIERTLEVEESQEPAIDDGQARAIARLGVEIQAHYGTPQDIEWVIDSDHRIWIVQSRPITATAHDPDEPASPARRAARPAGTQPIVRGLAASGGVASGRVRILGTLDDGARLEDGDVLVTRMTAPDWVPLMRRAAAIVTDSGGMTCHAAIVARELGLPSVVGTHTATTTLRDDDVVTVDGTRGTVTLGEAPVAAHEVGVSSSEQLSVQAHVTPTTATSVLVNLSEPSQAARVAALDCDGVGLLRAELMVLEALGGVHPRVLLEARRSDEFVERMATSMTTFAEAFAPRPITYRSIDFRTNEFRGLTGGDRFEPEEANPMIGYRGAIRYVSEPDLFQLELRALRRVWDAGHTNLHLMLPFVRTPHEVVKCRESIEAAGLLEDERFELWIMAEVPSVLPYLDDYAQLGVRGVSIGSNDLTQLVLGVDRDSELLAAHYDERDRAVTWFVESIIRAARDVGLKTSICGQAPSVHPEYLDLLVRAGIDSISVSADAVDRSRALIARAERRLILDLARTRTTPRTPATA